MQSALLTLQNPTESLPARVVGPLAELLLLLVLLLPFPVPVLLVPLAHSDTLWDRV